MGKLIISVVGWASAKSQLAESEPKVDLSMGRKVIKIPEEVEAFRRSVGLKENINSHNQSLR